MEDAAAALRLLVVDACRDDPRPGGSKSLEGIKDVNKQFARSLQERPPEGIVLLHGPGVRPGPLPHPANIYQVAPTVLYLLGLPQDERMLRYAPEQGGVIQSALAPEFLRRRPIRMVAEYRGTDRSDRMREATTHAIDPTGDEALERLRSLGYIR